MKQFFKEARELAKPFRVTDGHGFCLKDIDPGDTLNLKSEDKPRAKEALASVKQALLKNDAFTFLSKGGILPQRRIVKRSVGVLAQWSIGRNQRRKREHYSITPMLHYSNFSL